jgi:protease IV
MTDTDKTDAWKEPAGDRLAKEPARAENWERDLLQRLSFAALQEQRRARRWSIFFRSLLFGYLFVLLFMFFADDWTATRKAPERHTAVVEVEGIIADGAPASADRIVAGLRAAFDHQRTAAVVLRINSPGGSPVQAGYVNDEIFRLREKHPDIPLYAVVTDMCASGGYFIASAADYIYADKASVVGSIGVLMNSFGFTDAMERFGIERRLLTAGEHKGLLDPFSPVREEEMQHVQMLLDGIHQQFIDTVKRGRGARLRGNEELLFSGLIWTGEQSLQLGLVDGLGSTSFVAREVIGVEDLMDFTRRPDFFERLTERVGVVMAHTLSKIASSAQLR